MVARIKRLAARVRGMFSRHGEDSEFNDELRAHLDLLIEENVRRGMPPDEAHRLARIRLGNAAQLRETHRQLTGLPFLETLLQDIRYALRMLRKSPGFTAVAVLTLALGIGANTAIFSVIDAELLEPLPFKNPGRLVQLRQSQNAPGDFPLDGADYMDWQLQNRTFDSMSFYSQPFGLNASGAGDTESVAVVAVQANFFDTLGVQPFKGRSFVKGEDIGSHRVIVLSYGFWGRHFGSANALGAQVELNDEPYTVIGVMPRWFDFPIAADVWIPFDMSRSVMHNRGTHFANAIGRMEPGVTVEQAQADLAVISQRVDAHAANGRIAFEPAVFRAADWLTRETRQQLWILFGAVLLVLLVACANIANLLVARATSRQREFVLRTAMGASRGRLVRQLLTESLLLSGIGAAIGLLGAFAAVRAIAAATSLPIPRVNEIQLSIPVLLFAIALTLLVGLLFGVAPALQAGRVNLNEELKSSGNAVLGSSEQRKIMQQGLVVGQVSASLVLLAAAGLLLQTFAHLRNSDIGVQPANVVTMEMDLPLAKHGTATAQSQFLGQLLARIGQVPGTEYAAGSSELPLQGGSFGTVSGPAITNPILQSQYVEVHAITPEYFRVFGIPLIAGRTFNEQDMQDALDVKRKISALQRAAKNGSPQIPANLVIGQIINQKMAEIFWPHENALGKEFTDPYGFVARVIGIVGDVRQSGIRRSARPEAYSPLTPDTYAPSDLRCAVVVKTKFASSNVMGSIRAALRGLDSTVAFYHVRTMRQLIAEDMQGTTYQTFLLAIFAAIAVLLAAIGLYGVMAYAVSQRVHEIGIRMALGASPRDVLGMIIGRGLRLIAAGVVAGAVAALWLTRLLSSQLFGVSAADPLTFFGASTLLGVVALVACYIPARRATKVDPMVALRYE